MVANLIAAYSESMQAPERLPPDPCRDSDYMRQALALGRHGLAHGMFPIAAVIISRSGVLLGKGTNEEQLTGNPLDHAEMVALREAYRRSVSREALWDAVIYTTCEPCPMCLGAIYWAGLSRIVYANSTEDTASVGFDDSHIYRDLSQPREQRNVPLTQVLQAEGMAILKEWRAHDGHATQSTVSR